MGKLIGEASALLFHHLPSFRGRWRVLKALNAAHQYGLNDPIVLAQMRLDYQMKVDLRSRTEYESFYTGEYDTQILKTLLDRARPGWVVFDVGANVGFYSVPLAKHLQSFGSGQLYSFEPVPSNYKRLLENLALNHATDSCEVIQLGLSDRSGTAKITLREDFQSGSDTGNAAIVIADGQDAKFNTISITLRALDDFVRERGITRIDYIKVDIEGHEDIFFEGAKDSLARFRPLIQMEINQEYFIRRGINVAERLTQIFTPLRYGFYRFIPGMGWQPIASLLGLSPIEDILIAPESS
jgi:FkbM family methyltransferase